MSDTTDTTDTLVDEILDPTQKLKAIRAERPGGAVAGSDPATLEADSISAWFGDHKVLEAVSLTRSIPHGLAWAIGPYIESIPRESIEFTLHSVCTALHKQETVALKKDKE